MSKKIYFSTTEIIPFANVSNLAEFSTFVPYKLQDLGHDIRTVLPKYGFISERKYILREVIRLREIPFQFSAVICLGLYHSHEHRSHQQAPGQFESPQVHLCNKALLIYPSHLRQ